MIGIAARARRRLWPVIVLSLAGCAEAQLGAQFVKSVARKVSPAPAVAEATPTAAAEPAGPALAPEAFSASGVAVWDGNSTLEGVWFAHPLATKPQRVRVKAASTGKTTEGALFRRDPALPGPSVIVSSDAARALGLQPGAPETLEIVALRSDGAPEAAPSKLPAPAPVEVAAAPVTPPSAPAEGAVTRQAAAAPEPASAPAPPPPAAPRPQAAPAKGGFVRATDPVVEPGDAPREAPATAVETAATPSPSKRPAASSGAPSPSMRPETAAAVAAIPASPNAAADPTSAAPAPAGVFLRVGSFGVEANAAALAARLRARGLAAEFRAAGKLHVVEIGPLSDAAAEAEARAAAAAEGLADSFRVTR